MTCEMNAVELICLEHLAEVIGEPSAIIVLAGKILDDYLSRVPATAIDFLPEHFLFQLEGHERLELEPIVTREQITLFVGNLRSAVNLRSNKKNVKISVSLRPAIVIIGSNAGSDEKAARQWRANPDEALGCCIIERFEWSREQAIPDVKTNMEAQ